MVSVYDDDVIPAPQSNDSDDIEFIDSEPVFEDKNANSLTNEALSLVNTEGTSKKEKWHYTPKNLKSSFSKSSSKKSERNVKDKWSKLADVK